MTLKSEAGKVSVCLSVELGHALSSPRITPRNGPSRQRRRERRAAARVSAKETPTQNTTASSVDSMAGKLEGPRVEEPQIEHNATAEEVVENLCDKPVVQVDDEVCPDAEYEDDSPIIQVDGSGDCDDQVLYKFVSHYHKEDIGYCLEELFPKKNFELVSCVKERPYQSADQQCTVAIRKIAGQDFSWPDGKHDQVFREVRRQ